jgi:hypothetical protein
MAIATKNTPRRSMIPEFRSAAAVSRSIPATTEGLTAQRRRKLHNAGPQAPSGRHFISKMISSGKSLRRSCTIPRPTTYANDFHGHTNSTQRAPGKCTDDVVNLITTVQQIMTGLRSAEIEDKFAPIMSAVQGLVIRK